METSTNPTTVQYFVFGTPVTPGTLKYNLCAKYYGKYNQLMADFRKIKDVQTRLDMLDIREAFWCNEFRTEDLNIRRAVLLENAVFPSPI